MKRDRVQVRRQALLRLIRLLSRVEVCHATNSQLATSLGWSTSTVESDLDALEAEREIKRVRFEPMAHVCGRTLIRGGRWICLVSPRDLDAGADALHRLVDNWLPDRVRRAALLGPLGCTWDQLDAWLRGAEERGLIRCRRLAFGGDLHLESLMALPMWELPSHLTHVESLPWTQGRRVYEVDDGKRKLVGNSPVVAVSPVQSDTGLVRSYVLRRLRAELLADSRNVIARHLGVALSTVKMTVAAMVATKEIHSTPFARGKGRGSILSLAPLSEEDRTRYTPTYTAADVAKWRAKERREKVAQEKRKAEAALLLIESAVPASRQELIEDGLALLVQWLRRRNDAWLPVMPIVVEDLRPRVEALSNAADPALLTELLYEVHYDHRMATAPGLAGGIDHVLYPSRNGIRAIMVEDYGRAQPNARSGWWRAQTDNWFADLSDDDFNDALAWARESGSSGWVAERAADRLLAAWAPGEIDRIRQLRASVCYRM